jgi:hypothetical protein
MQKRSACGLLGLDPLQKMTAAMRMLTYGIAADGADEYVRSAVASQDLWIWHAFFGLPGSNNDLNVLQRSHVFAKLAEGEAPERVMSLPFLFNIC